LLLLGALFQFMLGFVEPEINRTGWTWSMQTPPTLETHTETWRFAARVETLKDQKSIFFSV
jgi:hypothetical protein